MKLKRTTRALLAFLLSILILGVLSTSAFADTRQPIVVSMGDSFASGEGIEPFYGQYSEDKYYNQDWLAHRSTESWEGQLVVGGTRLSNVRAVPSSENVEINGTTYYGYNEWSEGSWYFVATSAAKLDNIIGQNGSNGNYLYRDVIRTEYYTQREISYHSALAPQSSVFDYLDKKYGQGAVDYITVTIGANDAGLAEAVYRTGMSDGGNNSFDLSSFIAQCKINFKNNLHDKFGTMLYRLRQKAGPQAKILVVGYPAVFDGAWSNLFFSKRDMRLIDDYFIWFDEQYEELVDELKDMGMKNIYYISVVNAFEGHGAYAINKYISNVFLIPQSEDLESFNSGNTISYYSLHPNENGVQAYAQEVQSLINILERSEANKTDISSAEIKVSNQTWTGKAVIPQVTVTLGGKTLTKGVDYGVMCANNTDVGPADLTIVGLGNYKGRIATTFLIMHAPGWAKINGAYYYFEDYGLPRTNAWASYKGTYYYMGADGKVAMNCWATYKGSYYYLGADGRVSYSCWIKYKNNWYYLSPDGTPYTSSWIKIGTKWYYFDASGVCTQVY